MNKLVVSISGYGATGASAVVDFLKGFNTIDVMDGFEFQLHYLPDGIADLDYKLNCSCSRHYDSDVAITRFLELCESLESWYKDVFHGHLYEMAKEYIDSLSPVAWNGYWAWDRLHVPDGYIEKCNLQNKKKISTNNRRRFVNRFLRKLHLPQINYEKIQSYGDFFSKRQMYFSVMPENFLLKTRDFSSSLIAQMCKKDVPIVAINMLLPPQNPLRFYKYFHERVKSIVVRRDPRDLFILVNIAKWPVIPYYDVDLFVNWYRETMKDTANVNDQSILRISFEDLVYEYEGTSNQIANFLEIEIPDSFSSSFNPAVSANNTCLFHKYHEYDRDIQVIEDQLGEFLYDFSAHKSIEVIEGRVF